MCIQRGPVFAVETGQCLLRRNFEGRLFLRECGRQTFANRIAGERELGHPLHHHLRVA